MHFESKSNHVDFLLLFFPTGQTQQNWHKSSHQIYIFPLENVQAKNFPPALILLSLEMGH